MSRGSIRINFLAHIYQTKNQMGKENIDQLVYSIPCEIVNEWENISITYLIFQ